MELIKWHHLSDYNHSTSLKAGSTETRDKLNLSIASCMNLFYHLFNIIITSISICVVYYLKIASIIYTLQSVMLFCIYFMSRIISKGVRNKQSTKPM
jgi:hypothetical protein